jgi:Apolipoprotein N-acyltransferase
MRSIRSDDARRKNSGDGAAVEVSKRLLRLWPWLSAIISGLLGAAALPPFDQTWLIWIALVPLCATIFIVR